MSRESGAGMSRVVRGAVVSGQVIPLPVRPPTPVRPKEPAAPDQVLTVAHAQAEAMRAAAHREAEEIRRAAFEEGRAQGAKELRDVIDRTETLLGQIAEARDALLASVSGRVIDAIVHIAGVIAQGAIIQDRARMEGIVQKALESIREDDRVVLRLHPDDVAVLAPAREDLERACGTQVSIRSDRSVLRGGCVVETSRGLVDARLDTKLAAIHSALVRNGDAS